MNTTAIKTIAGYVPMPPEFNKQVGNDAGLTRAIAYSHPCGDKNGTSHYGVLYNGGRYACTIEDKNNAAAVFEKMKVAFLNAKRDNQLLFVGMGMSYPQRYDDDVCNHRIRTEIINPQGRKFFIEVGTWGAELTRFDHVIDRDMEILYDSKQSEYRNRIMALGGFNKVQKDHPAMVNYRKYQEQPYYWYKKKEWIDLRVRYTKQNILDVVNRLFDCNFNELVVDNLFLSTDDYFSVSK